MDSGSTQGVGRRRDFVTTPSINIVTDFQREALKHSFRMSAGGIASFVIIFIQGLIIARLLGLDGYGTFNIINMILAYTAYIQLGLKNAQSLLVPVALGKGNQKEAQHITEAIFTFEVLLTALVIVGLWMLYASGYTFRNTLTLYLLLALSATIFLGRIDELLDSYLLAYGQFKCLAGLRFFSAFFNLLFGVPFLLAYGLLGLVFSWFLTYLLLDSYVFLSYRIRFRARWGWKKTVECIKVGFPIHVNNLVGGNLWMLEKTLVALLLDKTDLGLYSFALLVFTPANLIPSSFNKIISRRMAEYRGRYGIDTGQYMKPFFGLPLVGYLFLSVILIATAYYFYVVLVMHWFPSFQPSTTVLQILIFGYPFFQLRVFAGATLTVTNRSLDFFMCQMVAFGINIVADYALIKAGYGIYGAAAGSSISYSILGWLLLYRAYRFVALSSVVKSALRLYLRIIVAWTVCYGIFYALLAWNQVWIPALEGEMHSVLVEGLIALLKSLVFAFGALGVFSLVFRRENFLSQVHALACESGVIVRRRIGQYLV